MCRVEKVKEPKKLHGLSRFIYYYRDENGCHICMSHRHDRDGYTRCDRMGKEWMMHRYLYFINNGDIPDGKVVRHKCDNPGCINPDHLQIGTQKDNMRDMVKRGRASKIRKKLSSPTKRAIANDKDSTIIELAEMYGVSYKTILDIRRKYKGRKMDREKSKPSIPLNKKERIKRKKSRAK